MKFLDMIVNEVDMSHHRYIEVLDGLTAKQANSFPASKIAPSIKSVTWLSWHAAREMDFQISALKGEKPLWITKGWKEKFNLPLPDDTEDWHHTPEQAAEVKVSDVDYLLGYLADAVKLTKDYVSNLKEADLDEIVDKTWTPYVTRGVRVTSIIDDFNMHSGQIIYSRRLLGLAD